MRNFLARLLYPTHFRRFLFFFLFDILIITVSLYLSFLLRFDFALNKEYSDLIFEALPFFIIIKLIIFAGLRMYKITWKYVGINDLCNIVNALIVTNSILMVLILFPHPPVLQFVPLQHFIGSTGFPRSVFLIDMHIP